MQIFIPSRGRASTITTHRLFDGSDVRYTVVLNSAAEREHYRRTAGIPLERMDVVHADTLVQTRQWILEHAAPGEWLMMMDDDVTDLYALEQPWYEQQVLDFHKDIEAKPTYEERKPLYDLWRWRFRHRMTVPEFLEHVADDIRCAEAAGINLLGYDQTENYYFRHHKYDTINYVSFDTFCVRRTRVNFDLALESIDDFAFTAEHLLVDGAVLVNHWIRPNASHYRPGGLGLRDAERIDKRIRDAQRILRAYPGLYRLKKLPGGAAPNPDFLLRVRTPDQLDRWREAVTRQRITELEAIRA